MFYDCSFIFHSHSVSIWRVFGLFFAHQRLSNRHRPFFFLYVVAANAISFKKNFSMAVILSVCSFRLLCCKIFMLKCFRRRSTLWKFHITTISRFMVCNNVMFVVWDFHYPPILLVCVCVCVCACVRVHCVTVIYCVWTIGTFPLHYHMQLT